MPEISSAPDGRILAIDDDAGELERIGLHLREASWRASTVTSLQHGVELAAMHPFAVCLLDRVVGGDGAADVLARLRAVAPSMRVILVTDAAHVDAAVQAVADGAAEYLLAPWSPDQLRIAVARQMETRRLQDRLQRLEHEVRELQGVIERTATAADASGDDAVAAPAVGAPVSLQLLERRHIEAVIAGSDTLDAAARTLGIDSSTLYRKRKAYGL